MEIDNKEGIEVVYAHYPYYKKQYNGARYIHRHYLIRLQVEGKSRAVINEKQHTIVPGDLLLLEPEDESQFSFEPDPETGEVLSGHYAIQCQGEWLKSWWKMRARPQVTHIVSSDSMLTLFKELVLEQRRIRDFWQEISAPLLQALCIHIDRALSEMHQQPPHHRFVVQRMKQYIESRLNFPDLRVHHVARHVGLSESRASHLFKEAFGKSIMAYCLDTRLEIACDRIKYTDSTLEHIADTAGFASYPHFNRIFRKRYGMPPSEYRKNHYDRDPLL